MHIFDYRFLKDDLLPAQLVNLTSNIFSLRTMMNIRKDQNSAAFVELETMEKDLSSIWDVDDDVFERLNGKINEEVYI